MSTPQHCPNCGRFLEHDSDGFYNREWPYDDRALMVQFCHESCCNAKRAKDAARYGRVCPRHAGTVLIDGDCPDCQIETEHDRQDHDAEMCIGGAGYNDVMYGPPSDY